MIANIFTVDFWVSIFQSAGRQALYASWDIVKIAIVYYLARAVLGKLVDRACLPIIAYERGAGGEDDSQMRRLRTLQSLLKNILSYVLFFVAAVMLLRAFHIDPMPVVTAAGVIGLAIGFGAQKLVKDVISGFFILLENQIAIGEYVSISGVTGTVVEVGMRITRIRGNDGKLYLLSNGDISLICNYSRGAVEVSVDVTISAEKDMDRVVRILNQLGEEFALTSRKTEGPFQVVGMLSFTAGAVTIRLETKALPPGIEDLEMAFREKVRQRLLAESVKLA